MKLVCISDTHNCRPEVPDGDILIHAGDLTLRGLPHELEAAANWLKSLPHKHKVVIAGNHDFGLQNFPWCKYYFSGLDYLQDQMVVIDDLIIWGSPYSLRYYDWAFMDSEEVLATKFERVPAGIDVLITHGPPLRILDRVVRGDFVGSQSIRDLAFRLKPKLHVFGHIHESHGTHEEDGVKFVNASYVALDEYGPKAANDPIIVEL